MSAEGNELLEESLAFACSSPRTWLYRPTIRHEVEASVAVAATRTRGLERANDLSIQATAETASEFLDLVVKSFADGEGEVRSLVEVCDTQGRGQSPSP